MAIAHIVIQIIESEDGTDHHINVSYSGGSDLKNQDAQDTFTKLLEEVQTILMSN